MQKIKTTANPLAAQWHYGITATAENVAGLFCIVYLVWMTQFSSSCSLSTFGIAGLNTYLLLIHHTAKSKRHLWGLVYSTIKDDA